MNHDLIDRLAAFQVDTHPDVEQLSRLADRRRRRLAMARIGAVGMVAAVMLVAGPRFGLDDEQFRPVIGAPTASSTDAAVRVYVCDGRLCPAITEDQRAHLLDALKSHPDVTSFAHESKAAAYKRFVQQFRESPELIASVPPETLPESYTLWVRPGTNIADLLAVFGAQRGVEEVIQEAPGAG